jgi:hypothetical protein
MAKYNCLHPHPGWLPACHTCIERGREAKYRAAFAVGYSSGMWKTRYTEFNFPTPIEYGEASGRWPDAFDACAEEHLPKEVTDNKDVVFYYLMDYEIIEE